MRFLNRRASVSPACLADFQHGRDQWDQVRGPIRDEVCESLEQLQGRRCAYCEASLDESGEHIEHFRPRNRYPVLTFAWPNLYWSCNAQDSCGRYKDGRGRPYDPNDLVDPCADDPDKFFKFRSNGTIDIRDDVSAADAHRARETLRVFNLHGDNGRLRRMRYRALSTYFKAAEDLLDLTPPERAEFVDDEIRQAANEPFSAAIRHLFQETL